MKKFVKHTAILAMSLTAWLHAHAQERAPRAPRVTVIDTVRPKKPELLEVSLEKKAKEGIKPIPFITDKSHFGDAHDFIITYMQNYLRNHHKLFVRLQQTAAKRFEMIDNVLTHHGLPKEIKYLAVIESALNNKALSKAGALGPWQFMAPTARDFGLVVNDKQDDRTDWKKSTVAAAKYIKILYKEFEDWKLVIAAYNSGPVPVRKAIAKAKSKNFWDIKNMLPRETQGHVMAFLSVATVFEKLNEFIATAQIPEEAFMSPEELKALAKKREAAKPKFSKEELEQMAIVRVKEPLNLEIVAMELKADKALIKKWNDDYDLYLYDNQTEEPYKLRIPKDKLNDFIASKVDITKKCKNYFDSMVL